MKILGISAFYHDSAAAIVVNNEIIAAAQEERFSRKKHDNNFPEEAIKYCLKEAGLKLSDLDAIAFYDKPLLKFERLLETYYAFAPKGFFSFLKAMPSWMQEKFFFKKLINGHLKKIGTWDKSKTKLLFPEHHLSHAASAFYPSNFEDAAILTIDGVGEWSTASICYGNKNTIELKKEMHFPHSVGLLYSAFTYYCGFKVNSGEYKLMGLAPYGNKNDAQTIEFIRLIKEEVCTIFSDGSVFLNQKFFQYAIGNVMTNNKFWEELFGISPRVDDENEITLDYCNLALAIQLVTTEIVIKLATHTKEILNTTNLCLAGGVALNCVI
ncbi:MAG: carbamoyltransferase, partial [Chitinophagaceae bacterium]|nr:carbamoyltransferase [Chitinophagaceae bacterium]